MKTSSAKAKGRKLQDWVKAKLIEYLDEDHMEKSIEGIVLDELKLNKQCCRRHMLTHVDVF